MAMLRLSSSKLVCQGRILSGILSHSSIRREKLSPFASSHSFSTDSDDAKKQIQIDSDDAKKEIHLELPQILESEMDARKIILKTPMPKVPGDFPEFPFTVREDHCDKNITMTRNFYDEKITIVVYMPDHMDDDENSGSGSDDSLDVGVTVRKESGNIMRLFLSVDQQQITVQNVCFENECDAEIDMEDGMMHLQDGLRKYLEARGIKKDYYPFFKDCIIHNSRKLRLRALNKLSGFVID